RTREVEMALQRRRRAAGNGLLGSAGDRAAGGAGSGWAALGKLGAGYPGGAPGREGRRGGGGGGDAAGRGAFGSLGACRRSSPPAEVCQRRSGARLKPALREGRAQFPYARSAPTLSAGHACRGAPSRPDDRIRVEKGATPAEPPRNRRVRANAVKAP